MSIVFNGSSITNPTYNGVALDKVLYNGVTVFQREMYLYNGEYPPNVPSLIREGDALSHTESNYIVVSNEYGSGNNKNGEAGILRSREKIDITNFKKLNIQMGVVIFSDGYLNTSNFGFGFVASPSEDRDINECAIGGVYWFKNALSPGTYSGIYSIDISKISGSYYFYAKGFWAYSEIHKIWLSV